MITFWWRCDSGGNSTFDLTKIISQDRLFKHAFWKHNKFQIFDHCDTLNLCNLCCRIENAEKKKLSYTQARIESVISASWKTHKPSDQTRCCPFLMSALAASSDDSLIMCSTLLCRIHTAWYNDCFHLALVRIQREELEKRRETEKCATFTFLVFQTVNRKTLAVKASSVSLQASLPTWSYR